jgi:hypothetical protein
LDGIKVSSIPFGFASFISSILYYVVDKDVHHVRFLRLRDVQIAFGILFWCLHPKTFLFISQVLSFFY